MLSHADALVVIASTWRLVHGLDALRKRFSPALASRIEGVTPDLPDTEYHVRHAEVLGYLSRKGLQGTHWLAVDDDAELYRPGAPLLKVDPASGFDASCAQQLRDWLQSRAADRRN